jgi:DNA repair exonuclease SbcCD ATPase subunit
MMKEEVLTQEFSLESIEERDGRFFFTAKALNKDFECEKGRERLAKDSKFKHFIWRHQHPVQKGNEEIHIFGRVEDAWLEGADNEIFAKYEIYGHTPDHLALREIIKERQHNRDPLGVSMRYRKYYIGDTVLHYDVLEHSGTPFPACTDCKGTNFEVETMVNEEKQTENTETELEEEDVELAKSIKKIEELEAQLNSKSKILEGIQTEMVALEKELKNKDKKLEEATKSEESLEQTVSGLKLEVERLKKKPIVDKILEYNPKIEKDEKYFEWLKDQEEDYLKEKLEEAKHEAETKPILKSQEESAEEAREKADEELEKKAPSMEHFTKHITKYQEKEIKNGNSNK